MHEKYFWSFSLIILLLVESSQEKGIGDYFELCHLHDPDISTCIERSVNNGVPRIREGIPEIGLPPLEPMEFDSVDMREGSGNLRFMMTLNNFTVEGFSRLTIENVSANFKDESNIIIKGTIKVPYTIVRGNYVTDGRVLIIPIKGDGDIFVNATSPIVKTTIKLRTVLNQKDNRKYMVVKSFDVRVTIKGGKSHFSNLFSGNKGLATAVNKFFSEHIVEIFDSIRHLPEKAFSKNFVDYCNIILKSYPFDELFLND